MRSLDSSEPSATSGSGTSDDEKAHPLDIYLAQRQAANENDQNKKERRLPPPLQPATSSEESGELQQEGGQQDEEDDFDDELDNIRDDTSSEEDEYSEVPSSSAPSSSSSGEDSDDEQTEAPSTTKPADKLENHHQKQQSYVPVGVTVLQEGQHAQRNAEMVRLLRMRRYFDDDFEENTKRCFKCGAAGHMARDCTNPPRLRSCYLCAEFGHDGRDCPNQLCWKCQRTGHQSRDCPFISHQNNTKGGPHGNKKRVRAWDDEDNPTVCLKCGRAECPCAGYGDYARAEGGCTSSYKVKDLEKVRCYVCGKRGHLACSRTGDGGMNGGTNVVPVLQVLPLTKLSCYNCGEGGHTAERCWKEKPIPMRAERQGDVRNNGVGGGTGGTHGGNRGSVGRYLGSGGSRYKYDKYDYQQQNQHHRYQERQHHHDHHHHHHQRHSYGGGGGGGGNRGGGGDYSGRYSQERRGRYSDYNDNSNKRRRYNDAQDDRGGYTTEDRSYAAQHGGGGGGDPYKWKMHSNAYGALDNSEYDGELYNTPSQKHHLGQRNKKGSGTNKTTRGKSLFNGSGGGRGGKRGGGSNMSNTRGR